MRLLLARHAKSSWKYPDLIDRERPLNKRGFRDARLMADRLLKRGELIDKIYTSPALRAQSFAAILAETFSAPFLAVEDLYTFSKNELWNAVWQIIENSDHGNIAIIGHNPAVLMLAQQLGFKQIRHFPTAAVLGIKFDGENKADINSSYLDYPKRVNAPI